MARRRAATKAAAVPEQSGAAPAKVARAPRKRKEAARTPVEAMAAKVQAVDPAAEAVPLHDGAKPNAFRTGVNIDALGGEALRRYARQIGLTKRDAEELGEDRLRMNCKARLFDMIETHLS